MANGHLLFQALYHQQYLMIGIHLRIFGFQNIYLDKQPYKKSEHKKPIAMLEIQL